MKKKNIVVGFLILAVGIGSTNAQNAKSEFSVVVENINAILIANSLAYYTDNNRNSAFIKKISVNEQGILTFTDSIPKTERKEKKLLPDCCPPKTLRTLDLLVVKNGISIFQMPI